MHSNDISVVMYLVTILAVFLDLCSRTDSVNQNLIISNFFVLIVLIVLIFNFFLILKYRKNK